VDEGVVLGLVPPEVALRGRRAVVGRVELAAGEGDRALEAARARRGGGRRGGDAAADQQDVGVAVRHRGRTLPTPLAGWLLPTIRRSAPCGAEDAPCAPRPGRARPCAARRTGCRRGRG